MLICGKGNALTRSMIFLKFWNIRKVKKNLIFSKIWNFKEIMGAKNWIESMKSTLRVLRAENWLTVYRTIAIIRKQSLSSPDWGPQKMMNQWNKFSSFQGLARWSMRRSKENLVERMLKIHINALKCRKRNVTTRLMISQSFCKVRKNENFQEKIETYDNFKCFKRERW